jgi:hypothetical protein
LKSAEIGFPVSSNASGEQKKASRYIIADSI